jgi:ribose transport system ATP-binding protein
VSAELRLEGIGKRYPGVQALRGVDVTLRPGEVHVLLGENGAGKSTLVKILAGVVAPDAGRIVMAGEAHARLTPELAHRLGIGLVHQELSLVPGLSVAENISLGRMPRSRFGLIDWGAARRQAERALGELGVAIDPQRLTGTLEVAQQQLIEIARVLAREPRVLLLDEPTSALSEAERARLFAVVARLRARGVAVLHISHHLAEVAEIGDRVTVLRDGRLAGTLAAAAATPADLVELMVGRRLDQQYPKPAVARGAPALRAEGLTLPGGALKDVSFTLHRGEILGVFGLMGAGQAMLGRALFGLEPGLAGRIELAGAALPPGCPAEAIRRGMGLVTRDRRQGLVPVLPVPPNVTLPWLSQRGLFAPIALRREQEAARRLVRDLGVQPPSLRREVRLFSGGNQQKVVLARWLASGARVLLLDEPTRGIDVGAKAEVFALISRLVAEGAAVLLISSELPELVGVADRVLVMAGGRMVGELAREELSEAALLRRAS